MSRGAPWRTARRLFALHQGGNDWYKIKAQADGPTQLYIYDEIGYFGVGASDLVRDLSDVKGPIQVHINSPGGEVWDGITIYNTLMGRRDVTVVIDGLAASIASVIACAGNPTIMAKSGQMVIHDGFCMAIGNAQDMRETADKLDRASNTIAGIYADRSGKTEKHWRDLMKVETTFGAQECLDAGLVDKIIEHEGRNAVGGKEQDWDLTSVLKNAASVPYVGLQQHRHIPMTGRHSHDHAAFGAEDHDDGSHHHVHEHNNDADHDHDHDHDSNKPGTGSGTSYNTDWDTVQVALLNHILDERFTDIQNWDASAAFAKCKTASDFRSIAFEKSNDSSDTSSAHYGLPHHASPGGGPDKGGVIAALGRWNQVHDLKNKDGALAHLKAHAKTLGLPSGDGDKDRLDDMSDWTDEEISHFIKALKGA